MRKICFENDIPFDPEHTFVFFRNELAGRCHHELCVLDVPSSGIFRTLLILDNSREECVFPGEGFIPDITRSGFRGYAMALSFLRLFGMHAVCCDPPYPHDEIHRLGGLSFIFSDCGENGPEIEELLEAMLPGDNTVDDLGFQVPSKNLVSHTSIALV